ncbi:matrixin family metalloprotease [Actinomarinicola tropica]|nr:matrixin family metalloprotease [Actinomarinicola tropica]
MGHDDEWQGGSTRPWSEQVAPSPTRNRRRSLAIAVIVVVGVVVGPGEWIRFVVGPPAEHADSASSYEFVALQADGRAPVTYSSCRPIRIEVNPRTMPPGAEGVVEEAVDVMAELTGLELVIEGETSRAPSDITLVWSPVLIAWSDPEETPLLDGRTIGIGGSTSQGRGVGGKVEVFLTGQVALDGPELADVLDEEDDGRSLVRAVVMHELGHVLGLDHVDDPSQLMHHDNLGVVEPGSGDRAGLWRLGQGPCIEGP